MSIAPAIKAKRLQICVFTLKDATYEDQPSEVKTIYDAFASNVIAIQEQYQSTAPIELDICPVGYTENLQIIERNHLDITRLPAVGVAAEYPDGSRRAYFLKTGLGGINFTPETVLPYITTLLYNRTAHEKPLICKILPPACEIGGWLWLAATVYSAYRTTQARNVGKFIWGGVTVLSGEAFIKGGGVDMVKKAVGIGKIYDTGSQRGGTRIDNYWQNLSPQLSYLQVEEYNQQHFYLPDAVQQAFGLHSIEFGNWMSQQDRLNFLYGTAVTMRDMAKVLGVSQEKIGLHKKLALSFGGRGKGGNAAAFYSRYFQVINLTKTKGKGTFCHEWGHAVDDRYNWPSGGSSTRKTPEYKGKRPGSIPYLFETVFDRVLWNEDGSPSSYQRFLSKYGEYLNRRAEIWARIVEAYFWTRFRSAGIVNGWGISIQYGNDWPEKALMEKVSRDVAQILKRV